MEENKLKVCVEVTINDGEYLFDVITDKYLELDEIRSILAGGLSLTIHGEETPKDQAKALRDVITYLENDFIDTDSFNNVNITDIK